MQIVITHINSTQNFYKRNQYDLFIQRIYTLNINVKAKIITNSLTLFKAKVNQDDLVFPTENKKDIVVKLFFYICRYLATKDRPCNYFAEGYNS